MAYVVILVSCGLEDRVDAAKWIRKHVEPLQRSTINAELAAASIHIVFPFGDGSKRDDGYNALRKKGFMDAVQGIPSTVRPGELDGDSLIIADAALLDPIPDHVDAEWAAVLNDGVRSKSIHLYEVQYKPNPDGWGRNIAVGRFADAAKLEGAFPEISLSEQDCMSVLPDQPRVRLGNPMQLGLADQGRALRKANHSPSDAALCVLIERELPVLPLGTALAIGSLRWKEERDEGHQGRVIRSRVWGNDGQVASIQHLTARSEAAYSAIPQLPLLGFGLGCGATWDGTTRMLEIGGVLLEGQWQARANEDGSNRPSLFSQSIWIPIEMCDSSEGNALLQRVPLCRCGDVFLWSASTPMPFEFADAHRCVTLQQVLPKVRECLAFWRANCRKGEMSERHRLWSNRPDGGGEIVARLAEGIWEQYAPWPEPFSLRDKEEKTVEPAVALREVTQLFKVLSKAPLQASPQNLVANFLSVIASPHYDALAWAAEVHDGWSFKLKTRDHYWIEGTVLLLPEELRQANAALHVRDGQEFGRTRNRTATMQYRAVHCTISTDSDRP